MISFLRKLIGAAKSGAPMPKDLYVSLNMNCLELEQAHAYINNSRSLPRTKEEFDEVPVSTSFPPVLHSFLQCMTKYTGSRDAYFLTPVGA